MLETVRTQLLRVIFSATNRIVLDFVTFLPGDEIPVVIGYSPEGSTIT